MPDSAVILRHLGASGSAENCIVRQENLFLMSQNFINKPKIHEHTMEGIIKNYKRSKHRQTPNQMIILIPGSESKDAASKLVGKKVTWKSPAGKELKGEVRSAHGNKGAIRVLFESGMPGQAIGKKVVIQ